MSALDELTPETAVRLVTAPAELSRWLERNGLAFTAELRRALYAKSEKGLELLDATEARQRELADRPNGRRPDHARLVKFIDRAGAMPPRLRQVARLCLLEGRSLNEAAAELGIGRETVRWYLRKLRAIVNSRWGKMTR